MNIRITLRTANKGGKVLMAKVNLHPLVKSVSGRVWSLVFYSSRNLQYARRYVIPHNPNTAAQKSRRNLFAEVVTLWQKLPKYKQVQWNQKASGKMMSGYNLFISQHLHPRISEPKHQTDTSFTLLPSMIRSHSVIDSGMCPGSYLGELFFSEAVNTAPS